MTQKVITPEISPCYCGAEVKVESLDLSFNTNNREWGSNAGYRVMCTNKHTLTKLCGTRHRAICKWNNKILKIQC